MEIDATTLQALKDRLKLIWTTGDYGVIARGLERSAEDFVKRAGVAPTDDVLDVACGTGQVAIPAAHAGARVTGVDLAEGWINQAERRAAAEGLDIAFEVGDAEALPYADRRFDVVFSLIGAMFAPRPDHVASEMIRVCRPGGRIVMGNWTPEGFIGAFFRTVAEHAPPPPEMPSPLEWGKEAVVRQRLFDTSELVMDRQLHHFDYPMSPAEVVDNYFAFFGPIKQALNNLDAVGRDALRADLEELWSAHNTGDHATTQVDAEILEVRATRA